MRFPKMISLSGAAVLASLLVLLPQTTPAATPDAGNNSGPAASSEDSLPVSTGKLDFQTDLFSGRFGYSVPIVASPARNGSEPSLALRYTSTGDNGWCGQGWELETGYIQRETRNGVPVKWSSGLPLNEYEDGKGFVFSLNGASSRLINIATNQFRAEIESGFLKFNYLTNSGGNSWLVTDTSGNKFYFGETADSRMVNTKWGSNTNLPKGTFRWALNRSVTVTGTTNQFTYQIVSGAQYPKYINYNGHASGIAANNQIEFELQSRTDIRAAYNSGYRVQTDQRLAKIYCRVGTTVVRRYDLAYTYSPSTLKSLLYSVTQIGLGGSGSLPPVTLQYSQQERTFQQATWTNVVTTYSGSPPWITPSASDAGGVVSDLVDMDGDSLPDRLLKRPDFLSSRTNYFFQRNTGSGFGPLETDRWGPLTIQTSGSGTIDPKQWDYVMGSRIRFIDLNGDGRPDHVMDPIEAFFNTPNSNYDHFVVDFNYGTNFSSGGVWTNVLALYQSSGVTDEKAVENTGFVRIIDMNGDGLPDRVLHRTNGNSPYTNWWVQFNTGGGFEDARLWGTVDCQGQTTSTDWGSLESNEYTKLVDINGDGLPDRVMAPKASGSSGIDYNNFNRFVVQFNNGAGFESAVDWGPVNSSSDNTTSSPTFTYIEHTPDIGNEAGIALRDFNGDGLPDRILSRHTTPYTYYLVQFNTGTGFTATNLASLYVYGLIDSQGRTNETDWTWLQSTYVTTTDMNGDGLPDRVMATYPGTDTSKTNFVVSLSKGPFPDLLTVVSNGIGGSIKISYDTSAKFQNRETSSTSSKGLLPFPSRVVTSVATSDGLYPYYTNFFGYEGGYYDPVRREFAGFHFVSATNTLGQVTQTWFHQGGGRDDTSLGEFEDDGNFAKRGIPFRTQIVGTNGQPYQVTVNRADQYAYGSSGRYFAFVSQNTRFDYPGTGAGPRTTASSTLYDTTNGNVTNTIAWGEVTNFVATDHSATDVTTDDDVYQWTTYASLSNADIVNKPLRSWTTSDSGAGSVLGESLFAYDGSTGNLLQRRDGVCPDNCYETNQFYYNGYGNLTITTNEAGIVTTTDYDSTKTFPVTETTASFVSSFLHDPKSGVLLWSKASSGLVSSNQFDSFFRLTNSWVSASSNGSPSISLERRSYNLGGIASYSSANYVKVTRNDTTSDNPASGLDSYTYSDGLGRVIQTRAESETNNTFRVAQTVYDERGAVKVVTQPVFLAGTTYTVLGTANMAASVNEYDPIGRLKKTTSPMNVTFSSGLLSGTPSAISESGSLIGSLQIAYNDGGDPWTRVVTDESGAANGLVRKYSLDAFGRTNVIYDVFNGTLYATNRIAYDRLGRMTNLVDAAGNQIQYAYNYLGQMIAMADPNLGYWQYQRDYAGRVKEQIDGKGNTIDFNYADPLGRLKTKTVTPAGGGTGYTVTYDYDTSSGSGFTVYPGQLAKVTDNAGTERYSYDVRGRTLKTARDLNVNSQSYTNQFLYDNADRQISAAYPVSGPTVTNRYDAGGNLTQVQRVDAGGSTLYFQSKGYSQLRELLGATFGNGTEINYTYYPKTRRLQNLTSKKTSAGTNFQALAYTYNEVGDITSITDSLYTSGTNSATISSVLYDHLHRLTSLTRPSASATTYSYNVLGNMTANGEQGGSTYVYPTSGILPHAVRIVGTKTNAYDLVGNMVFRAGQSLAYDPENRLTSVVSGGVTLATFGYADDGDRLWKQSTNTLSVWIGDLYEAHGTTNLFHIFAGSRRIATYSPGTQLPGAGGTTNAFNYYHPDHLGSSSLMTDGNGSVAEHYEYSAYGRERANGTAAPDASHRFTGQIFDAEVELYYYGARYYDADLGRFIQADTEIPDLFDPQSWNRYAYANNNPLKYTDPTGHDGFVAGSLFDSRYNLSNSEFRRGFQQGAADALAKTAPLAVGGIAAAYTGGLAIPVLEGWGLGGVGLTAGAAGVGGVYGDLAVQGTQVGLGQRAPGDISITEAGQSGIVSAAGGAALHGLARSYGALKNAAAGAAGTAEASAAGAAENTIPKVTTPVGDLRAAGLKDAHHVVQDAAVRNLSGYNTQAAPGVQLPGPSTSVGSPHYLATQVQRQAGGGTLAAEMRIGYKALRQAGYSEAQARQAISEADAHFRGIGASPSTPTRIPGNRN